MTAEELEQLDMLRRDGKTRKRAERHVNRRFGEGFLAEDSVYGKAWFLPCFFVCKNPTFTKTPCSQQLLQLVCALSALSVLLSFCPSVRLLFLRYESNQLHSTSFHVVVDSDVALSR